MAASAGRTLRSLARVSSQLTKAALNAPKLVRYYKAIESAENLPKLEFVVSNNATGRPGRGLVSTALRSSVVGSNIAQHVGQVSFGKCINKGFAPSYPFCDVVPQLLITAVEGEGVDSDIGEDDDEMSSSVGKSKKRKPGY